MLRCYTPEYNQRRPHSALSYRPPAPESRLPRGPGPEFYPMEWALNGPRSNLEVGLVPGGKVTAGLMDKRTLLEFDALCLTPRVCSMQPDQIRALRERARVSQAVFALYLHVSTGLISQWEHGEKPPAGAPLSSF